MIKKQYTDSEIINAILLDNSEVLSFLYEHNFESLNNKIISEGGSKKDTEDIFHDALLIFYLKVKNKELQLTCSVHTFLQSIARNLWKRKLASNASKFSKIEANVYEISDETHSEEEYIHVERRKLYLKHLEEMPGDCKRLIQMVLKGLNLQRIMELMPFNSIEFTKTKRFRCKVMLIKKILNDPLYKELKDEGFRTTGSLPRW
jgi:DNA-directed RNA polymerase specialized sigma24 family protein